MRGTLDWSWGPPWTGRVPLPWSRAMGTTPPLGAGAASMMMANTSYLKDSSTPADPDQVKPKKDFRYKLKSFKRRTEQKVLESFGKSPQRKAKETAYDALWDKVSLQEQVWNLRPRTMHA